MPPATTPSGALSRALLLARISLAFGRVERATFHEDGSRPETDTDHTVMLGLVACELAPVGLDRTKIAAFALVHDLVEVYAGDTPTLVVSPEIMAAKAAREDAAKARLFAELGDESWLASLLATYEQQREPEARFVRLIDKVLPKLTHAFNGCAAARKLTDRDGFFASHTRQLQKLQGEYPEFSDALNLLRDSMSYSEKCWPEAAPERAVGDTKSVRVGIMQAAGLFSVGLESDDPTAAERRARSCRARVADARDVSLGDRGGRGEEVRGRQHRKACPVSDHLTEARRFSRQTRFIIAGGATARPVHELDAVDRVCDELEALRAEAAALTARAEQAEQERDALRASARVVLDVWSALGDGSVSQRKFNAALDAMREAST